jgi:large conductance mechanosensitive channel
MLLKTKAKPAEGRMLKKFRDFAMRGNVVDPTVGVIIGVAFGKIVDSLVGDIFMPVLGAVTGGLDFSNYYTGLSKTVTAENLVDAKKQGAVLAWGNFITVTINFIIIAGVLFLVVNAMQKFKQQEEAAPPPFTRTEKLLQEIRELLKK